MLLLTSRRGASSCSKDCRSVRRACFSNSYLFGRRNSGYVKGTITNVVRYHFVPTDVRRHRLISISYMSLLPCHSRGYGFESRRRRQFFMVERLANPLPFVVSGRLSRSASQRELALLSFICRDQTGRVLLEVSPQPPFSKPWLRPLIMTRWHR